jgi:hypothetical protein
MRTLSLIFGINNSIRFCVFYCWTLNYQISFLWESEGWYQKEKNLIKVVTISFMQAECNITNSLQNWNLLKWIAKFSLNLFINAIFTKSRGYTICSKNTHIKIFEDKSFALINTKDLTFKNLNAKVIIFFFRFSSLVSEFWYQAFQSDF